MVNNAGIHADAPMAGMSGEQWRSVVEVLLHGFFNVTRPLLLPMIGTRWGAARRHGYISGQVIAIDGAMT